MSALFDLSWRVASVEISTELPSLGVCVLFLLGIAFFILLEAFFVASEFAIVKVRPSQLGAVV